MRNAFLSIFLVLHATAVWSGVIEHEECCPLPTLGKTVFMFGEQHTDPFDPEAVAQRDELSHSIDTIIDTHTGPLSCYLECDINVQRTMRRSPYIYTRNVCDRGAFFDQWYVPLARSAGDPVALGRLCISNFDIRDDNYAQFEQGFRLLVEGEIPRDAIDFDALRTWAKTIDTTLQNLLQNVEISYPKKMVSYIGRDMARKKKRFDRVIDIKKQLNKRARYTERALEDFYDYTDLLVDLTILNKVATDPREAIIINAGSAHTQNVSRYFNQI